ncbi:hypothetical protein ACIHFD_49190 [Nonomuraea sp. NPDC051941]|uniref:hypothetical protein n=1 Tax=Nonomuraea sp. NPDC051941 TaxID=3364373 RepID=UPI0037C539FD
MPVQATTSPPLADEANTSVETATFNAPANSLLVAAWMGSVSGTLTIAGGDLTWTARATHTSGRARLWTAPCPSAKTGMKVSLAMPEFGYGGFKAWVVTGAKLAAPVGASGTNSAAADPTTFTGYTSTTIGSLGFCAAYENNLSGGAGVLPTSGSDPSDAFSMKDVYGSAGSGLAIRKAAAATAAGQAQTFTVDAPPAIETPSWAWAAIEIVPDDSDVPTTPGNLRVTAVAGTSLTVAWDPSTDSSGIAGYGIYLDGAKVGGL